MLFDRREFLSDSAILAALAAAGIVPGRLRALDKPMEEPQKGGPMDRLRVACVGVAGRGMAHVGGFAGKNNCIVTTICDCDEGVIGKAMDAVEKAQGKKPAFVRDIRKVVEDPAIDIVSIATPNHWHALMAIWALQHGKHVYVEKPVSHNVLEGRRIVEAAERYGRLCQTGTQSRSAKGMRDSIEYLRSGKLGKIRLARGLCYKRRPSIGKVEEGILPKTCDYDLWCGPAPMQTPLRRAKLHYDWHWIWAYGNGDLGNQGIHEMDKARWGLGKMELPRSVISLGGRFGYEDNGETANTQLCVFDYGDCELIFEVRGLPTGTPYPAGYTKKYPPKAADGKENFVGNIFYGEEGVLVCPSYSQGVVLTPDGEIVKSFTGGENHFANFVAAVRSGKRGDLTADILEGHLSSALCHLGNISYRLGTPTSFGDLTKVLDMTKESSATLTSMVEHLRENKVDLDKIKCAAGRKLTIDPKAETFVGDKEADLMLTREYRKGFEVPSKV
jgi:predicted dehydrogenase